jgi:hypothetical protein
MFEAKNTYFLILQQTPTPGSGGYGNCICTGLEAAKSGGKLPRAAVEKGVKPFLG